MTNEYRTSHCKQRDLNITLPQFEPDGRVAFVDHVCKILSESRYGYGSAYQSIAPDWSQTVMDVCDMPDSFFDLTGQMRMNRQDALKDLAVTATLDSHTLQTRRKLHISSGVKSIYRTSTTLARGSPPFD